MSDDKLRQYLFGVTVSIVLAMGGCGAKALSDRVGTLEAHDRDATADTATIKQDLRDFRQSFEDFKADYKRERER